ncbi:MAG: hypothetical protein ABSH04_08040, partial [Acidimicrobiales bacterium]
AQTMSTAADQLRVASVAMAFPSFAAVVAQPTVTLPIAGTVTNYVRQVGSDGIVGVKSGFTQAAMGCLVLAAKRQVDGHEVLVMAAVTGQLGLDPLEAAASATMPLIEATAASLREVPVIDAGKRVAAVVTPWSSMAVAGIATGSVSALAWPGDTVLRSMSWTRVRNRAPARTKLGTVEVTVGPEHLSVPVRSVSPLPGPSLAWRLEHL